MLVAAPTYGLAGVWTGLFLFMTLRVIAGFWRSVILVFAMSTTFFLFPLFGEEFKLSKIKDIDYIVVDPARKGCDQKFLDTVIAMKIMNIVYISCLPQSLARDAKYLVEHGYEVKEVTPVDMFSQTGHVESIATLTLKR